MDINAEGGDFGNALQAAADGGEEGVVRFLLKHEVDISTQGGNKDPCGDLILGAKILRPTQHF